MEQSTLGKLIFLKLEKEKQKETNNGIKYCDEVR